MTDDTTASAYRAWNRRWQTEAGRADWLTPEAEVVATIERLRQGGARRALDLGCGVGRHALAMAAAGLETCALDGSHAGLNYLRAEARRLGLDVELHQGLMTALPYPDAHFDFVLAFNVIYHGDRSVVAQAIGEIHRVLKPDGLYQGTMLSKRNIRFGAGREVAPDTFVIEDEGDKIHPHYYCNAAELIQLFGGFELLQLSDREHASPGSWHWYLLAERLA